MEQQQVLVERWSPLMRSYLQMIDQGLSEKCPQFKRIPASVRYNVERLVAGNDLMVESGRAAIQEIKLFLKEHPNGSVTIHPQSPGGGSRRRTQRS